MAIRINEFELAARSIEQNLKTYLKDNLQEFKNLPEIFAKLRTSTHGEPDSASKKHFETLQDIHTRLDEINTILNSSAAPQLFTAAKTEKTVIRVIRAPSDLKVRGQGEGLSWEKDANLTAQAGGISEFRTNGPVEFKFVRNGNWETSQGNRSGKAGETVEIAASDIPGLNISNQEPIYPITVNYNGPGEVYVYGTAPFNWETGTKITGNRIAIQHDQSFEYKLVLNNDRQNGWEILEGNRKYEAGSEPIAVTPKFKEEPKTPPVGSRIAYAVDSTKAAAGTLGERIVNEEFDF